MSRWIGAALVMAMIASPTLGQFYVAGDFNGWNAAGNLMNDDGGGIYSLALTLGVSEFHEFKVTDGTWGDAWPETGNSWFVTDGSGNITITYDTNTYADGWSRDTERIGLSFEPASWVAVGNFQDEAGNPGDWDNASVLTAMSSEGGGIYSYSTTLPEGAYEYKAVWSGSWNAIGADARSVNANTFLFTTTAQQPIATMKVDALTGVARVDVIPEPTTAALALLGLVAFVRRRR